MNILLISDQLPNKRSPGIDVVSWNEGKIKYSFNEYHILIIDLSFPKTWANLNPIKDLYLSLEGKLNKDLINKDGLILFVICGYEDKPIFNYEFSEVPEEGERYPGFSSSREEIDDIQENGKIINVPKNTYEFFKKIDLETFDRIEFTLRGNKFTKPANPYFRKYFDNVEYFFLTLPWDDSFTSISPISKAAGIGNALVSFERRLGKGFIIFLPGYCQSNDAFEALLEICQIYYNKQQNAIYEERKRNDEFNIPQWVNEYKTDRHKAIPIEIDELEEEKKYFDRILYLLYGKHIRMENEVKLVLEDLGMTVLKTEKGESIDLIATLEEYSLEFFIEVTGSNHSVNIESKKVNQVIGYKAKHPEKKVILLANAFCNLHLTERIGKENFAEKVVDALGRFDILMMTTFDLYFLWKNVYKKKADKLYVLRLIENCREIFQIPQEYLPEELKLKEEG